MGRRSSLKKKRTPEIKRTLIRDILPVFQTAPLALGKEARPVMRIYMHDVLPDTGVVLRVLPGQRIILQATALTLALLMIISPVFHAMAAEETSSTSSADAPASPPEVFPVRESAAPVSPDSEAAPTSSDTEKIPASAAADIALAASSAIPKASEADPLPEFLPDASMTIVQIVRLPEESSEAFQIETTTLEEVLASSTPVENISVQNTTEETPVVASSGSAEILVSSPAAPASSTDIVPPPDPIAGTAPEGSSSPVSAAPALGSAPESLSGSPAPLGDLQTSSATSPMDEAADEIFEAFREELKKEVAMEFEEKIREYEDTLKEKETLLAKKEALDAEARELLKKEAFDEITRGCLTLDNGGYFCLKDGGAEVDRVAPDRFKKAFSEKDKSEGDQEIYFQDGERVFQITDNGIDDVAPQWDKEGSLIAWQGQVRERWQIFVHDRNSGETKELSSGDVNNINPKVRGGKVVWQGWDNNNWEVFLASGESGEWKVSRITNNSWHDVDPKIAGGLVMWQAFKNNVWQVFAYDIQAGALSRISSGVTDNKNPRIAVIWESEENNVVKTLAYDLASGEVIALGAEEKSKPETLPRNPLEANKAAVPQTGGVSTSSSEGGARPAKGEDEGSDGPAPDS